MNEITKLKTDTLSFTIYMVENYICGLYKELEMCKGSIPKEEELKMHIKDCELCLEELIISNLPKDEKRRTIKELLDLRMVNYPIEVNGEPYDEHKHGNLIHIDTAIETREEFSYILKYKAVKKDKFLSLLEELK
jgi:hypothetical protein